MTRSFLTLPLPMLIVMASPALAEEFEQPGSSSESGGADGDAQKVEVAIGNGQTRTVRYRPLSLPTGQTGRSGVVSFGVELLDPTTKGTN